MRKKGFKHSQETIRKEKMKTIKQLKQEIEKELTKTGERYWTGDDEFKEGNSRRNILKAKLQTLNEVEEIVKEEIEMLENPYPKDIFPELDENELKYINFLFSKYSSINLDRLSASLMRRARENVKEELKQELLGEGK